MTPQEAIEKLKTLPEDQQRAVLGRLAPEERQGIITQLRGGGQPTAPGIARPDLPEVGLREQFDKEFVNPVYAPAHETTGQHVLRGASNVGGGAIGGFTAPVLHPLNTAHAVSSLGKAAFGNPVDLAQDLIPSYQSAKEHPEEAIESGAGNLVGGAVAGEALGGAAGLAGRGASALRTAAIGDADAAALRGLRVPPSSSKGLRTVSAVEGSRPFLKGAANLEDVQAKLPAAKSEVWGPYKKTIDSISDKPVKGPDGQTTVGELESERQQLSALNRDLKAKDPQAIQTAQQKGMSQAQLLDREKAVQQALDPYLEEAGIDPKLIRKTFGQLATVEGRVAGRTTIAEPKQAYGFSRLKDVSLTRPLSNIPLAGDIARDVTAGRYFSAKPTDVALREGFRLGGEKPDFRAPSTSIPRYEVPPKQLEANVPGNSPYGEDFSQGPASRPNTPAVIPQQRVLKQLPSITTPGEVQPMIQKVRPIEPPEPTEVHVFPGGSQFRGVQETPYYPAGSQFRNRQVAPFDIDEYLRQNP